MNPLVKLVNEQPSAPQLAVPEVPEPSPPPILPRGKLSPGNVTMSMPAPIVAWNARDIHRIHRRDDRVHRVDAHPSSIGIDLSGGPRATRRQRDRCDHASHPRQRISLI